MHVLYFCLNEFALMLASSFLSMKLSAYNYGLLNRVIGEFAPWLNISSKSYGTIRVTWITCLTSVAAMTCALGEEDVYRAMYYLEKK
jgi:hypothetical protein